MSVDIATIGVGFETDELVKGKQAMDAAGTSADTMGAKIDELGKDTLRMGGLFSDAVTILKRMETTQNEALGSSRNLEAEIRRLSTGLGTVNTTAGTAAIAIDKVGDEAKQAAAEVDALGKQASGASTGLDKAGKSAKGAGDDFDQARDKGSKFSGVANELVGRLGALASAYVGTQTIKAFIEAADAMAGMETRLKNVIGASGNYKAVQDDLYRISQENNVSIKDTSTLYARLLPTLEKMGGDTKHASLMTESLSTALRINKASTSESSSAILQFSQAMASGVLRGEEFNSVNEAAPQFLDALAQGLGVGKGELRKMAEEGKLTADVVGNEMPAMMRILKEQTYGLKDTVSDSMSDMKNDTLLMAQALDKTSGATEGLGEFIQGVSGIIKLFTGIISENKTATNLAGEGFDKTGAAIRIVGTIAETVLVVMSEVTHTLTSIGREAGGLAAQVALVVTGNFKEARQVGIEMEADAKKAREAVDKYNASVLGMTEKVLAGRAALKEHGLSAKENGDEMQRLTGHSGNTAGGYDKLKAATGGSKDADKDKKAALKELAEEEKRQGEILLELTGFSKDYAVKTKDLSALYAGGKISLETFVEQHDKLLEKQPLNLEATKKAIAAAKDQNAEWDKAFVAQEKDRLQVEKRIKVADDYLKKLQQETSDLKLNKEELALVTAERYLEKQGVEKGTEAYDAYIKKIREAVVDNENTKKSIDEMKKIEDAAKKTADNIEKGLIDSLFRAFESGKDFFSTLWDGVKNTFKTTILKPLIEDTVKPFNELFQKAAKSISETVLSPIMKNVVEPFLDIFKGAAKSIGETVLKPGLSTDGMGSFFDALKGGFSSLMSSVGNAFSSLLSSAGSMFNSLFGGGGSGIASVASGAGGAGGGLGSLSSLGSLAGAAGTFGSGLSAGFGAILGEAGLSGGISAGMTAIGAGNVAGGMGTLIGSAGPYALAAIAAYAVLNKLFGSKGGPKVSGLANTGGFSGLPSGGQGDSAASAILQGVGLNYSTYAKALGGEVGQFSGASFFAKDPKGTAMTQLVLDAKLNGQEIYSRNNRTTGGNVEDVGRSDAEFATAVANASTEALIAALKATKYADTEITAKVAALNASMGGQALSAALQEIVTYKEQQDALKNPAPTVSAGTSDIYGGSSGGSAYVPTAMAVSTEVMGTYTRIMLATELTAERLSHLQTWVYESSDGAANRVRQALYDIDQNEAFSRDAVTTGITEMAMLATELGSNVGEIQRSVSEIQVLAVEGRSTGPTLVEAVERNGRLTQEKIGEQNMTARQMQEALTVLVGKVVELSGQIGQLQQGLQGTIIDSSRRVEDAVREAA